MWMLQLFLSQNSPYGYITVVKRTVSKHVPLECHSFPRNVGKGRNDIPRGTCFSTNTAHQWNNECAPYQIETVFCFGPYEDVHSDFGGSLFGSLSGKGRGECVPESQICFIFGCFWVFSCAESSHIVANLPL